MTAHQVRQRLGGQREVVQEQVLEDGGEQRFHFRFRNEGDPVLQENSPGADELERLGEMNLVVAGAAGAKTVDLNFAMELGVENR